MRAYAGVGSRETPEDILTLMERIAARLAREGYKLRSGHAPGADQAFERGALEAGGAMSIFLPWPGFESAPADDDSYIQRPSPEAYTLAAQYHPAWARLGRGARSLHARNVHQVLGRRLLSSASFLVCWTPGATGRGGTGQAIRIATAFRVPVFDLAAVTTRQRLEDFLA